MMKKILIVEDEDIIAGLIQKKLSKEGYEVARAEDGVEGLEKMKKIKPNLVLLDIVMPKMGGFEMLEKINKTPELKRIPVVIISNSGQPVELDRAKKLGVRDWLIKTEFDPQEVVDKVIKQIGR